MTTGPHSRSGTSKSIQNEPTADYCKDCIELRGDLSLGGWFCPACTADRTPKIYPCNRCHEQFKCSSIEALNIQGKAKLICKGCRTYEEQAEFMRSWLGEGGKSGKRFLL